MKAKITKKDGTVIELEGTAAELTPIIDPPKPQINLAPPDASSPPSLDLGKLIDEGQGRTLLPYQPIDSGFWQWPRIVYNDMCPMGGAHDYPQVWNGIFPPPCSKCWKAGAAGATFTVCTNGDAITDVTSTLRPSSQIPFLSALTLVGPTIMRAQ